MATLCDQRLAGALRIAESERRVFAISTGPVVFPGTAFGPGTGVTFAGCNVGCVLQIAAVVTPCLQRVQDAVSVVTISAGGKQTPGVIDQVAPMLGEKRVLCEGDGGDESCIAGVRALLAEEGLNSVTMLIVTREGDRRCKLRPSQRAVIALVYLREHTTYAKLAAGFRISEGTTHAYVQSVVTLLASRAPSLTQALRRARPEYVLVDGTIAECNRVGDRERDYSGKARRHGVNIQAVTGPVGELI